MAAGPGVKVDAGGFGFGGDCVFSRRQDGDGSFLREGNAGAEGEGCGLSFVVAGRSARCVRPLCFECDTAEPVKQWSRNAKFDLYSTAWLPDYDATGEHLATDED